MYNMVNEAELTTYMAVLKVDGSTRYYKVVGGHTFEIDEATYIIEAVEAGVN